MFSKKSSIFIITLTILLLLSISSVNSTNDKNTTQSDNTLSTTNLNDETLLKSLTSDSNNDYDNKIYVKNNGNQSSNGHNISNPTTLKNAFNQATNNTTIILDDENNSYVDVTENITINNLGQVSKLLITSTKNITLRFYSGYSIKFDGNYDVNMENIGLTNYYSLNQPAIINKAKLTLTNCSINGFKTINSSIYNQGNLTLKYCNAHNNTDNSKSLIYSENATVNIYQSMFHNNQGENGGVLSSYNSIIYCENSTFHSNKASFGGVYSIRDNSRVTVKKSEFKNNSAYYGGGVINSWYSTSNFNNSYFTNNTASYGGITYDINNIKTEIINSFLQDNHANESADNIYSFRNNLTLKNNAIITSNDKLSIYCYNTSYNLDYNWWGNNAPKFNILTNNILPNNWRIMKAYITNNSTNSTINVSINHLSDSKVCEDKLINRSVKFSTVNGTFGQETLTIEDTLLNTYTGNYDDVTISIDNEKITLNEKTTPYLYLSNITTKINDNTTITIKCNPDIKDNISIYINNQTFKQIIPTRGMATINHVFNSSWNNGTYTLTASIKNNTSYKDLTVNTYLTINNNYNTSIVIVSPNILKEDDNENLSIPLRWNLDTAKTYQTSIKNQGKSGSCWAFSTLATLESALLKTYGIEYNFSENNMKNVLKKYSTIGDVNTEPNTGNHEIEPIALLVGWYGPVNEEEDKYNDYSIMSPVLNNSFKVEDVYFIYRSTPTGKDNKALKQAIMKYGALSSSIYSGTSSTNVYTTQTYADHAITIVGWDDFYNNFYGSNTPSGAGAYIIKNSWGNSIGTDGYQYVSYYDTSLAGVSQNSIWNSYSYAFPVQNYQNYTNIYQHDTISTKIKTLTPSAWIKNVYTANKNESIAGIGTYIYKETDYQAQVYVNNKLYYTQNGTFTQPGYRIIKLEKYIPIHETDQFHVTLKLKAKEGQYTSITIQDPSSYKSISKENQSFISTDGENWEDLYTSYDNRYSAVCLKVYTKETPSISSVITTNETLKINTKINNLNQPGTLTYKIDNEYYKDTEDKPVTITVNNNTQIEYTLPLPNINKDEYNITIILETENYTITENVTIITPVNITISTKNYTYYVDDDQIITVNVNIDDENINSTINNGQVILTENEKIISKSSVTNGQATFKLNLNAGNHTYKAYYSNTYTTTSNIILNITINKHDVNIEIQQIENNIANENMKITGKLSTTDGQTISNKIIYVNIDGKTYNIQTDKNALFTITHFINRSADYNIKIEFKEDSTYHNQSIETIITTQKQDTKITINPIDEYYLGETANITGTLHDKNNNKIKNATITLYNNEEIITNITTDKQGTFTYSYNITTNGTNRIQLKYEGNNTFNPTTTEIIKEATKRILINTTIKITGIPDDLAINDTITINITLQDQNNNTLKNMPILIYLNNNQYNKITNNNGEIIITHRIRTTETIIIQAIFNGTKEYNNSENTIQSNPIKKAHPKNTTITVTPIENITTQDNITITGTLQDNDTKLLNNENILIIIENKTINTTTQNGTFTYITTITTPGYHNIIIKHEENDYYLQSEENITFYAYKKTTITLNTINNTTESAKITIIGNLSYENTPIPNMIINLKINNENYTTITNTEGIFTYEFNATYGTNNITATFNTTGEYSSVTGNVTFYAKKESRITVDSFDTLVESMLVNITGRLLGSEEGIGGADVLVDVNGVLFDVVTDDTGCFVHEYEAVAGLNEITVTYNGSEEYADSSAFMTFNAKKKTALLIDSLNDTVEGRVVRISGKLLHDNQGIANMEVILYVNNETSRVLTDSKGFFFYDYIAFAGMNKVTAIFEDTEEYSSVTGNVTFYAKKESRITVDSFDTLVESMLVNITGRLLGSEEGIGGVDVLVDVNGVLFDVVTDDTGCFVHEYEAVAGLNEITVTYNGSDEFADSSAFITFNAKKKSVLYFYNVPDVVEGSSVKISGKLLSNNKAIPGSQLILGVNGVDVVVTPNRDGYFSYTIKAVYGVNNVSVIYDGSDEFADSSAFMTFNVKKKSVLYFYNVLDVVEGSSVKISGKLLSNNKAIPGSQLILGVNGVDVVVTPNRDGYFSYTTKAVYGVNNITATFETNHEYASSSINTTFYAKKKSVLYFYNINNISSGVQISGKLLGNGKSINGSYFILKINSENITITPNKEGYFTYSFTPINGINNIFADYPGSDEYAPSNANLTFSYENIKKSILYFYNIENTTENNNVKITGKLLSEAKAIKDATIILTINGNEVRITPGSSGYFSYNMKAIGGINNITAYYEGDSNYQSSKAETTFFALKKTTLYAYNMGNVNARDSIKISGKLLTNGKGVYNKTINVIVNENHYFVTTNNDGYFSLSYNSNKTGTNNLTLQYDGDTEYIGSNYQTTFITKKKTTLYTYNVNNASIDDTVKISGKLVENGNKLANKNITIIVGSETFNVTTNYEGYYQLNYKPNNIGVTEVKISYAGTDEYWSSNCVTSFNVL